jgi:hypothetical protein
MYWIGLDSRPTRDLDSLKWITTGERPTVMRWAYEVGEPETDPAAMCACVYTLEKWGLLPCEALPLPVICEHEYVD